LSWLALYRENTLRIGGTAGRMLQTKRCEWIAATGFGRTRGAIAGRCVSKCTIGYELGKVD
jgi:hypothetical protein